MMEAAFTIEEAEEMLPFVSKLVKKAQKLRDKIVWLLETNNVVLEVTSEEGFHYFMTDQIKVNKEFHNLYHKFYSAVEELNEIGVIVKDIDEGLIDFPFVTNGKEAFLCWRLGEEKIRYWHDVESGFEGRQPIVDVDELFNSKEQK